MKQTNKPFNNKICFYEMVRLTKSICWLLLTNCMGIFDLFTAQKMKFSIMDFFSKCKQIFGRNIYYYKESNVVVQENQIFD